MSRKKRSNKAGLVLISLVLIGYAFINVGEKVTFGNESVQAPVVESLPEPQQECTNCTGEVEEEIIPEKPQAMIALIGEEYTVDVTGEVKGWSDVWDFIVNYPTCNAYDPAQDLDSVSRLCGTGGTQVNLDERSTAGQTFLNWINGNSQVNASAITNIELTTVTYPLAFFLGQFVIKNSNREASLESPNYPSNGQIIDKNYTLKTHSPADSEEYSKYLEETVRKDYEVSADVDASGTDGTLETNDTDEGKYGVMNVDDAECACKEPEVSNSDYNPGSPNRQGSVAGGWSRQQAPGGDNYEIPNLDQCLARGEDYQMMAFGNVAACFNLAGTIAGKIEGAFSKIFSRGEWENCNDPKKVCTTNDQGEEVCTIEQPSEYCTGTMQLGVKMTPIFGDPYKCEDELCANAYLTNSYKAGLGPREADSKIAEGGSTEDSLMFFIGTPCVANVSTGNSTRSVGVTCLWDASPYLLDYKLQKSNEAPNDEEFPSSFEVYWDLVQQAMELSADYYGLD